jgi:putative ABC transport system ATP-binding protein
MQRVAVARALLTEPALLLADEPTGNLDSKTGTEVLRLLREATRQRQLTVVMVTHDPRAAAVGDRIVRLADGAIVGDEPVHEQAA